MKQVADWYFNWGWLLATAIGIAIAFTGKKSLVYSYATGILVLGVVLFYVCHH